MRTNADRLKSLAATKRYAVECDTPDLGETTYPECTGPKALRGRVLSEHDNLSEAVAVCNGKPGTSAKGVIPWIWDRVDRQVVKKFPKAASTQRILAAGTN